GRRATSIRRSCAAQVRSPFSTRPAHVQPFFFTATAPPELYPLSLHDALPIWSASAVTSSTRSRPWASRSATANASSSDSACSCSDRKSTRLNSSHRTISYAVFCLKKKTSTPPTYRPPPRSSAEESLTPHPTQR